MKIHRKEIAIGWPFKAPSKVTFGYQASRDSFSVWYNSQDALDTTYLMLPTDVEASDDYILEATSVVGHLIAMHLLRKVV